MGIDHLSSLIDVELEYISDRGLKAENQDCVSAKLPKGSTLASKGIAMVIADGVSSASGAMEASHSVVKAFLNDYYSTPDTWSVKKSGLAIIHALNRWLWSRSHSHIQGEGYLTTLSVVIIKSDQAHVFHVGDSRIYRLRQQQLTQLTRDHSTYLNQNQSYLARAIGGDVSVDVDYSVCDAQAGDYFFASTDGIHDFISEQQLVDCISSQQSLQHKVQHLHQLALQQHSDDNLSCQLLRIQQLSIATAAGTYAKLKDLPFPPHLDAGHKLDGLVIIKQLHASERSQLYLVQDANKTPWVMKTPSLNYQDDSAYIERFMIEEWIGSRVNSPNVLKIKNHDSRSFLYYLSEYITGPTLGQLIKERQQLTIADAIEMTEQLVKGVRALHRKETLHQDIKPDNIMLTERGATLIDFGACSVAGINEISTDIQREMALGTLHYSAPEYYIGSSCSAQSDQFSIAAVLYEMLTGQLPYSERYLHCVNMQQFNKVPYHSACISNPLVPIWMDNCLKKALSMDSKERYANLSEFIYDLKQPNPQLNTPNKQPLIEQHPVLVWQACSGILLLSLFMSWGYFLQA